MQRKTSWNVWLSHIQRCRESQPNGRADHLCWSKLEVLHGDGVSGHAVQEPIVGRSEASREHKGQVSNEESGVRCGLLQAQRFLFSPLGTHHNLHPPIKTVNDSVAKRT